MKFANAAIEALDTEIGRLLQSLDPEVYNNTLFIFLGDNGSDPLILDGHPYTPNQSKSTHFN